MLSEESADDLLRWELPVDRDLPARMRLNHAIRAAVIGRAVLVNDGPGHVSIDERNDFVPERPVDLRRALIAILRNLFRGQTTVGPNFGWYDPPRMGY